MGIQGTDSNLIEHILNLLSIPEYSHMEIEQIMDKTASEGQSQRMSIISGWCRKSFILWMRCRAVF